MDIEAFFKGYFIKDGKLYFRKPTSAFIVAEYSKQTVKELLIMMNAFFINIISVKTCSGETFSVSKVLIENIYKQLEK